MPTRPSKKTPTRQTSTRAQVVAEGSCQCGFLARASAEPMIPITFDAAMNEYHLMHVRKRDGHSMIRFCQWCGGAAPRSLRPSFFATITQAEEDRVRALLRDVETLDAAVAKLGKPDRDFTEGLTIKTSASDDKPPTIKSYRVLLFTGLSPTADVRVTDYGPDGGVRTSLGGKFLGRRQR